MGAAALAAALGRAVLHPAAPPPPPPLLILDARLPPRETAAAGAPPGKPRGIPDLKVAPGLTIGGDRMVKGDGALVRFSLGHGVDVGAGAYVGKTVSGGPSDMRFVGVIRLPFP